MLVGMFINHLTRSSRHLLPYGIRHMGTIAEPNVPRFFNRRREIEYFTNIFKTESPRLHIVLGPPSSGKTTLIRRAVSDVGMSPLFIDLRYGQFDTPVALYSYLLDSIFKQYALYEKSTSTSEIDETDIIFLLKEISAKLPGWNCMDIPPPILVIDEANRLREGSPEMTRIIQTFLQWMVANTAQDQRFHIVLTSSDSLFLNWIQRYINNIHFETHVIGDLTNEDAEKYFEEYVLTQHKPFVREELTGKFHQVRNITGTRMFLIDQYVNHYSRHGKFEDRLFPYYASAYDQLKTGLSPETLRSRRRAPAWQPDDLVTAMRLIVDQGFAEEDVLIDRIGGEKLLSLVKYNFLHRRPISRFTSDLVSPPNVPILTPMSQPALRVMRDLVEKVDIKRSDMHARNPFYNCVN